MREAERIFVGIHEVGDATLVLSRGLRALGHPVTNVVRATGSPLLEREDTHDRYIRRRERYALQVMSDAREYLRSRRTHDVFIFNFCESFVTMADYATHPNPRRRRLVHADLRWLHKAGKRLGMVVNGSDMRAWPELVADLRRHGHEEHARMCAEVLPFTEATPPLEQKEARARIIEDLCNEVFVRPNSAQYFDRPHPPYWLPLDRSEFLWRHDETDEPLVVHAPSNSAVKGTKHVEAAIEELRDEGLRFRFELVQGKPNPEVRALLSDAHIAIDQLVLPGYGLFAAEAMQSGAVPVGSAIPGYNAYPEDLPLVSATPSTLADRLRELITSPDRLLRLAKRGPEYVRANHDHVDVARRMRDAIGIPPSEQAT